MEIVYFQISVTATLVTWALNVNTLPVTEGTKQMHMFAAEMEYANLLIIAIVQTDTPILTVH